MEVVMAMGITGLVVAATFAFYTTFSKNLGDLNEEIEISQDLESGQRILLRDLKAIDVCFGVVNLEDDNGKQFFEIMPDVPEDGIHSSLRVNDPNDALHPTKRVVTLKAGGRTEITLLLHDPSASLVSTLNYTPSWAYNMANMPLPAFVHVNKGSVISTLRPAQSGRRGFWAKDNFLMFDVPAAFRSPAQLAERGRYSPRPVFFVGRVTSNSANAAFTFDNEVRNIVNYKHPVTGTDITDANAFFWNLPSVAGGMPIVRLRPVRLVKYLIEEMNPNEPDPKKKGLVRLIRWVYTGSWDPKKNRFMVADKLRSVQFRRDSVTQKTVLFDLSKQELN